MNQLFCQCLFFISLSVLYFLSIRCLNERKLGSQSEFFEKIQSGTLIDIVNMYSVMGFRPN